jgi:hypothetical protein
MKVHPISGPPPLDLARALEEFEKPFTYPLGVGTFFRISHGKDYTLFFRAQGNASCFVAEREGRVIGVLGTVIRRLWLPNGTEKMAAYFGDLKIAVEAQGGTVLLRLARAAERWLRPKVEVGFGIVMGGTKLMPDSYTGRAGVPSFENLGHLVLFRISGLKGPAIEAEGYLTDRETGLDCYRRLITGRYACPAGDGEERSEITPIWLMNSDGAACGMLEDTRKAKRLIMGNGEELLSGHLSCFAYRDSNAGAELIRIAFQQAVRLGLPALFVSVAERDAEELRAALGECDILPAPAFVYGAGLRSGDWNINSSEI